MVMGEAIKDIFITNNIEKLTDVSDKVDQLEWKVPQTQSVIGKSIK